MTEEVEKYLKKMPLVKLLSEISGVFQILELQSTPLEKSQRITITNFIERIELALEEYEKQ